MAQNSVGSFFEPRETRPSGHGEPLSAAIKGRPSMIRREWNGDFIVIAQPEHARLSGALAGRGDPVHGPPAADVATPTNAIFPDHSVMAILP